MNWDNYFARRTSLMRRSTVREFLKYTTKPGMISFAGGLPDPELLPVEEMRRSTDRVLTKYGAKALQYSATEGIPELRDYIAERFRHVGATADNVLITTGSQQALELLGRVLLDEGDTVAVQNPTYLAALSAWRAYGVNFSAGSGISPITSTGARNPKFIYCIPNFRNPTGESLDMAGRIRLVEHSRAHQVPLLEDDPYGELRYDGEPLPSLFELSSNCIAPAIYVGTVSKILAPGLRVGWIVASPELIDQLVRAKQAMDLHTSTLCQYSALELLRDELMDPVLCRMRAAYRAKRDLMLELLSESMPSSVSWTSPKGGMFILLTFSEEISGNILAQRAMQSGVAVVPGADFHVVGGLNTIRLSFSYASSQKISEGIGRLASVVPSYGAVPDSLPA